MKTIQLTKGKQAVIDDEDLERVSAFKWTFNSRGTGYAVRNVYLGGGRANPQRKTVPLHRFIMNAPDGLSVDHINGNGLDCRKENMRLCTHAENTRNKTKHKPSKSGYKGVHLDPRKKSNSYQAIIRVNNHIKSLGYYSSAVEGAKAYNKAALKYFGEYANLNRVGV